MHRLSVAAAIVASTVTFQMASAASPAPVYRWTGWYAGLNAGGIWGGDPINTSASTSQFCPGCGHALDFANASIEGATGKFPVSVDAFIGGGQFGYNWLLANGWVAGFEADVQGLAGDGSTSRSSAAPVPNFADHSVGTELSVKKSIDFLGTVRGRLGYQVMPSLLVFGTGGFGYGHVNSTTTISQYLTGNGLGALQPSLGTNSSVSKMRGGWTLGGGFEWMFAPNWSAKGEYLYYDLGSASYGSQLAEGFGPAGGPAPYYFVNDVRSTTHFNGNIVRAGVNYHY